jgi:undecaprenyl-diphosphatase
MKNMGILDVFILSVIEGITEFLPISSTGHLILTSKLLGIAETNFVKTFEIVIQLGAIMAVVVLYTKRLLNIKLLKKLFIAFIPTAIIGLTLYPFIKNFLLGNSAITLHALFWGGVALIIIERFLHKKEKSSTVDYEKITYKKAFLIGSFQCLSIIPGMSRAAATIIGGLSVGIDRATATEFSFLLAVPTMLAASALDIYKSRQYISQSGTLTLFVGTVLSFIFAMIAIKFLVNFVKKHNFTVFGIYRIVLAVLFWIFVM